MRAFELYCFLNLDDDSGDAMEYIDTYHYNGTNWTHFKTTYVQVEDYNNEQITTALPKVLE